jgi:ABC-type antimicrobial peptide transport system permease subunit
VAGLGLAWAGSRSIEAFLFEVTPLDPLVWWTTPLLLALVGLGAGLIPARGATRIDPAVALRDE